MSSRDNSFQFIKIYASLGVVFGHVSWHLSAPILGYNDGPVKPFFHLGVPVFFLISAYFLYPSYIKAREKGGSVRGFLLKRYIRIAPSVYIVSAFAVLLFLLIGGIDFYIFSDVGFWTWILNIIVLYPIYNPGVFSDIGLGVINGSLWTIAALVLFYLSIPIIHFIEKKIGFKNTMNLLFLFSIMMIVVFWSLKTIEFRYTNVFQFSIFPNFIFFTLGILWSRKWSEKFNKVWLFIIAMIVVVYTKTDGWFIDSYFGEFSTLIWALPYSFVIIWFGINAPKFFKRFNKIDDLGMGIFIWHMVVVNLLIQLNFNSEGTLNNYYVQLVVLIVTVILAYLSRRLIEKPLIAKSDNKFKTKNHNENVKSIS